MRLFAVMAEHLFDMDESDILTVFNSLVLAISSGSETKFHQCNIQLLLTVAKFFYNI